MRLCWSYSPQPLRRMAELRQDLVADRSDCLQLPFLISLESEGSYARLKHMRKYSIRACLIVPVLIAGWASASATDLPPPPTHNAERALLVKKAGRTLPMKNRGCRMVADPDRLAPVRRLPHRSRHRVLILRPRSAGLIPINSSPRFWVQRLWTSYRYLNF